MTGLGSSSAAEQRRPEGPFVEQELAVSHPRRDPTSQRGAPESLCYSMVSQAWEATKEHWAALRRKSIQGVDQSVQVQPWPNVVLDREQAQKIAAAVEFEETRRSRIVDILLSGTSGDGTTSTTTSLKDASTGARLSEDSAVPLHGGLLAEMRVIQVAKLDGTIQETLTADQVANRIQAIAPNNKSYQHASDLLSQHGIGSQELSQLLPEDWDVLGISSAFLRRRILMEFGMLQQAPRCNVYIINARLQLQVTGLQSLLRGCATRTPRLGDLQRHVFGILWQESLKRLRLASDAA